MKKLAIICTHPIQYYAPVFALLHQRQQIAIKVFYTGGEQATGKFDTGFGRAINWDIPLLEGYPYEWAINTSTQPGSHHFNGIINPDLISQITRWQPDTVLIYGWAYHSHLKAMRYFKNRIPVYFRGDSTLLDDAGGLKSWLRKLSLKWIYRHIDYAFYVGTHNKAYFKRYGLKESQLGFAPHAIDNKRFEAVRNEEVQELKTKLNLNESSTLIVFAGKFEEKKNPLLLLKAFMALQSTNAHLLYVGNGHLEHQLKETAKGHCNIHFLNFQNQSYMPVIYQAADIFCMPSKGPGETWGLAVNEAMACGKPIITSDKVGCAIDLVQPDQNGFIFKSNDVSDLVSHLTSLTGNKALLNRLGLHSKQIIKNWTFEAIATAIEHKLNA